MVYTLPGLELHYRAVGEGTPVVLLHGLGCNGQLMEGCMEPVFRAHPGYRRFYPDLPGMGASSARASLDWAGSDRILDALLAFLDDAVPGDFLLAGESYGGYLARGILARRPERVKGLLLLCPMVRPAQAHRTLPKGTAWAGDADFLAGLTPEEREGFCLYAAVADAETYARYARDILPGLTASDPDFLAELDRHYGFSFDVDAAVRALDYPGPVLMVAGRQDTCVGYRDLLALLEDYPRATYAVLDLAGHNLQVERPELFEALAGDWLTRVEGQRALLPPRKEH